MVSSRERRWVVLFAIALLTLTTIPYLIGYQRQGSDWRFSGFVFGADDGDSYIAKMLRGANGDWLFRTPYTASPQRGFMAFLPYLLLGKLTAPPGQHDQLVALFHLFRWGAGILMVLSTYSFIAYFIDSIRWRQFGTALAVFGGGLGWLSIFGLSRLWNSQLPLEFYSPESFGFLSLFGLPHLALARALLLWGLLGFLTARNPRQAVLPGVLWLLLGFVQPLTVITGWALLGVALLVQAIRVWLGTRNGKQNRILPAARQDAPADSFPTQPKLWQGWLRDVQKAAVIGIISSPVVIYTAISFLTDPYLKGWSQQNIILSPPPGDYLLAFGMVLPLVIAGVISGLGQASLKTSLLVGWLAAFPFLAYAPYNLQRRLPDGIWVALVVMALLGLLKLSRNWRRVSVSWLSLSFLPAVILITGGSLAAWTPAQPLFHPVERVKSFEYLGEHALRDDVVLAGFYTSNELPAWAPLKTLIGHGPESIGLKQLELEVRGFFQPGISDAHRLELIQSWNIRYVIYGPEERELGGRSPVESPFLRLIYKEQDVELYQYQP